MKGGQKRTGVRITFLLKKNIILPSNDKLYYQKVKTDDPVFFTIYSNGVLKKNITNEYYFQESEYFPLKINSQGDEKLINLPEHINKSPDEAILMLLNSIKESNKGKHVLNKVFYKHSIKTFTLQKLASSTIN